MLVHRLANSLASLPDIDMTVVSCDGKPDGAKYKHRQIFPWLARSSKIGRLFLLPLLLNTVDFSEYDVVHLHGDDWFWLLRPCPTVRTLHGSALWEARMAKRLRRRISQFMVYPLEHLSKRLATRTAALGRQTQDIYGTDLVIGCPVDTSLFTPRPKSPTPTLTFIGLWDGRKRGELMFDSFVRDVVPKYPDAVLHMVSDVCARSHPNVVWHRYLEDADLTDLLAKSWLFTYPSSYEGFGIPYIEAMASGTAIVTTRNAGAEEVMKGGECGWICSDEDFSNTVNLALSRPDLRASFERIGRQRAGDFTTETIRDQYVALYRELGRPAPNQTTTVRTTSMSN
jgi:glycosyltransferase involved in cell wall biosynthesis